MDEKNLNTVAAVAIHQNASTLSGHGLWSGIQSFRSGSISARRSLKSGRDRIIGSFEPDKLQLGASARRYLIKVTTIPRPQPCHEMGHVLVAASLRGVDPVQQSI